jgi:iron(III) transport system ATP-binding protein
MPELEVGDLAVRLGLNEILRGVSLTVSKGEIVALLGPSGSGKTTLLRAVAGLETPTSGRIRIGGRDVFDGAARVDVPVEKRDLGLVFQSYALWPHRTVFENVAYGLKLRGIPPGESTARVAEVLDKLGLATLGARHPHELSGGQQQRVALARAIVYNPPVLLLDEPLSNLDAKLREEARGWLRGLIAELRIAALCVTHDQADAMAMSDRIVLLREGRVEQEGTPEGVYRNPASLFAAEFMGSNNRFDGRVAASKDGNVRVDGAGWSLWGRRAGALPDAAPATSTIRVERTRLVDGPGENRLQLPLVTSLYLGDRWEHVFGRGDARLRVHAPGPMAFGSRWIELPPADVWVFPSAS